MRTQKQRIFSFLVLLTMVIVLTCIFVACDKGCAQDKNYTVTIHPDNGQADFVWDTKTDIPSITRDGYHIVGYYLDADMTISTSLESLKKSGLTKNVDVYVKWEKVACNHVEVIDNAVDPTCTTSGLTQGKHCSICGEILQKQIVVDALGHDSEHHEAKAATCTEIGWNAYDTCKRAGCDYTTYQEIPALGHKYSQDWSNDKTYHWHASTCGHDVVSDKGKHTFDSNWVCTECAYADTGLHGVELRTNTLELDGTDIYGKVSNATSTFSFINEIAIADSASYTVSTDINGSNVIRTKTVSLGIGDNTFYILVENGKDLGLYTVVIRRRPIHTVSFDVNGGTSVSSQNIEEDSFATAPTTERKGYTFDKWDYDFSKTITKDTTITASWNINTYTITYELNGWENSSQNVYTYTIESGIITLYDAIKGESLFCGWYLDEEYKNYIATIDASTMRDYTVYAYADDSATKGLTIENDTVKGYSGSVVNVVIPAYYKGYFITSIDGSAFYMCDWITSITIPYSVNDFGHGAFSGCSSLTEINWNATDARIRTGAGSNDKYMFLGCYNLTTVNIGDNVNVIPSYCFYGCNRLKNVTIGNGVTRIGAESFYYCSGLTSIKIPDSVTTIDNSAFKGCSGLTSVIIGNGVTKIGNEAFRDCIGLTNIIIPSSVTSIDSSAFYDCYRLVEIYNKSSIEIVEGSYSNGYVGYYAKNVYTSEGGSKLCVDLNGYVIYTDGDNKILIAYRGNAIDLILPTGIVSINQYAFYNYSRLNSITMSNSIMFIGEAAFSKCSNLASITIPNGVTSICDSAFSECSSLVSVKIPNSVTMLGSSAFYNCNSLTSVTIPNSVTRIESYTFSGCSSLESINFKGTIEQWNAIIKGNSWNYGVATDCTITCSDGTI